MASKDLINSVDVNNPSSTRRSVDLLPAYHRTDKNTKFLSSTLDQFIQQPQITRVSGYLGSKLTPNYNPETDEYIAGKTKLRSDYQLEPSLVISDVTGAIMTALGYDDLIGQLSFNNASTKNLDRLFRPESYSYDPHIDWDKFVNFRQYYWMPVGPDTVEIYGKQKKVVSTYSVVDSADGNSLIFSPDGATTNPLLTLYRGLTYVFNVNSIFPFYIKTAYEAGTNNLAAGVTGQGTKVGQVTFTVDEFTPKTIYYFAEGNGTAVGKIVIDTITEDTELDIEADIIGKKTYTSYNGVSLSNGMKVRFGGKVFPESYLGKEYFVEGVGTAITLVDYTKLQSAADKTTNLDVNFDATPFDKYPFDDFEYVPLTPEYITINRASVDQNEWSKYNRWVHADVITKTAAANGVSPVFDNTMQAQRPIVEFKAGLQLYNYGSIAKDNIDLIDITTKDPFRTVENSTGYYVDGIAIEAGYRIVFNAATDPLVRGKIYEVKIAIINNEPRINLEEALDSVPVLGNGTIVTKGDKYSGSSWWFDGITWIFGQQKTSLNQFPLFELYDKDGNRFADETVYKSSFQGTKVFGYEIGTVYDSVLGFNLSYRNVANVGEYLFDNYFMTDTFTNFVNNNVEVLNVSNGFLKVNTLVDSKFVTVWTKAVDRPIPIIQYQVVTEDTVYIQINAIDNPSFAGDLQIDVFVNDIKQIKNKTYTITSDGSNLFVVSTTKFSVHDRVLFKLFTLKTPNDNGYYEPPINLTNNPLNGPIGKFTYTELGDHVKTMVDNHAEFVGTFPGLSNLRDVSNVTPYGTRLVSHGNPISFAHYFLSTQEDNIIEAVRKTAADYNQFKSNLMRNVSSLKGTYTAGQTLDLAMLAMNRVKESKSSYNYSDMIAYGKNHTTRLYTVSDIRTKRYSLATIFDDTVLSERCVLVYINNTILTRGYDYVINQYDPSITILKTLVKGDIIEIHDFPTTAGSFISPTPTKLGLYPKFKPQIFTDNSYVTGPQQVIQGHDGSLTIAFGDYRDEVLLEFETRIYNNIKVNYNPDFMDCNEILPGAFRTNDYTQDEITKLMSSDFLRWAGYFGVDYQTNSTFDELNSFTFNYTGSIDTISKNPIRGFWRGVYKYFYDTDRPNTHPWEMLGFSEEPSWWNAKYGPAPYTKGNTVLWADLEAGSVNGTINPLYARPGLSTIIPVDDYGNLLSPTDSGLASTPIINPNDPKRIVMLRSEQVAANWQMGDYSPAETAWRRSSWWPYVCQIIMALGKPAKYGALCFDTSRVTKNLAGEYRYGTNNSFLNPTTVAIFGDGATESRVLASGYSVFVVEAGLFKDENYISYLKDSLATVEYRLMAKLGGFASKDKLQVGIDAVDPTSPYPGVLVPAEDYEIFYNVSQPFETLGVSGLIIQKTNKGWTVRGYDKYNPYFTVYKPFESNVDQLLKVGGVSEPYVTWSANTVYQANQVVFYQERYYRVLQKHTTTTAFIGTYYQSLPSLPIVGGVGVFRRTNFDTVEITIPYGVEYTTIQDVYDFIVGYGKWLEAKGFVFDEYQTDLETILDWTFTAKEFLYWTTQNWAVNAVITLSPFANQLTFRSDIGIVDSVTNNFYEFSLLKADGATFPKNSFTVTRLDGQFQISTINTQEGLFYARLNLIQKEHAIVYKNFTLFNDVIYDVESGYRQRRIKIKGFVTANWNGDFFSPGFIFDQANISDWEKYTDYKIGDVVRFSGNYYSAKKTIAGTASFDITQWAKLNDKPTAQLLPNFDYKINQFEDFYSLDIDNFDVGQQRMAQHLIGYTPRPYLNYIVSDPIAQYKFYQGMIRDKGTKKSLTTLGKATLNNFRSSIDFNEEWAFRIGYYGGYNTYSELETPLVSTKFLENPQIIQFVENKPTFPTDTVYYKDLTDLPVKPADFDITSVFSTSSDYTSMFKAPVAGYVRTDDITATAYNKNTILDIANNGSLKKGDTIWLGFKENGDWDVLRVTEVPTYVTQVSIGIPGQTLIITTYYQHQLSANDLVSITGIDPLIDQCYIIQEIVNLNQFVVLTTLTSLPSLATPLAGLVFAFKSSRMATFDSITNIPYLDRWAYGEKIWVDSDANGQWAVYKKTDNYSGTSYDSPVTTINGAILSGQHYGAKIAANDNSNLVIVAAPEYSISFLYGEVFVLYKNSFGVLESLDNFSLNDSYISTYYNTGTNSLYTSFGQSLDFDTANNFVVAGAPKAGRIKHTFTATTATHIVNPVGSTSTVINQGAVKISYLSTTTSKLTDRSQVITTPTAVTGTNFGWSIALSTPYATTNTFRVATTSSVQIGYLLTGTNISGLPLVTAIGNNNITVSVPQAINTSTSIYFNTKVRATTDYPGTTKINVASTAGILLNSIVQGPYISSQSAITVTAIGEGTVTVNTAQTINTSSIITFVNTLTTGYTIGTGQKLYVGAPMIDATGTGSVYIYDINFNNPLSTSTTFAVTTGSVLKLASTSTARNEYYGYDVTGNTSLTRLAVSAPGYAGTTVSGATGAIYIYDFATTSTVKQTITANILDNTAYAMNFNDVFGPYVVSSSVAVGNIKMSADGEYLIVSSPYAYDPTIGLRSGVVDILKWDHLAEQFKHNQRISVPISAVTSSTIFGFNIDISPSGETLVISSVGESKSIKPTFDKFSERSTSTYESIYVNDQTSTTKQPTTFDGASTTFSSRIKNAGTAHVYNKLGAGSTRWAYSQELANSNVLTGSMYGSSVTALNDKVYVGAPAKLLGGSNGANSGIGQIFEFGKIDTTANSWSLYRSQDPLVDVSHVKRAITIDTLTDEVKDYIDIIDPIKGRILGKAEAELRFIGPYDPAIYSVGTTGVNINSNANWLDEHVGELWWDLSTVKYVWYEQGELEYRKNNWNNIFPGSSIDVYEWVRSQYLPSEWAQLADTAEGLTKGISGQPKFNDNSIISVKQVYNTVSNSFSNVYYFWVKNKVIAPSNVKNRSMAAFEVAKQIADPVGTGAKFLAAISPTAFVLANTKSFVATEAMNLNISFDSDPNSAVRHTEWQLVQENDPYANVNSALIQKMIDSLLGHDSLGNPVPDPTLSSREAYGVQIRPRQSMFVNRNEALRNVIEFVNSIIINELLVGQISFDNLTAQDQIPLASTYDTLVADIYNLELIITRSFVTAELEAVVDSNGTVSAINIVNSGFGYVTPPTITVTGSGTGVELEAVIDQFGSITSVNIINAGRNYTSGVSLYVRPYTVVVQTDSNSANKWAVYEWNDVKKLWIKIRTQDYNTALYWNYTHWISPDYDPTIDLFSTVSSPYALQALNNVSKVGSYVKVQNAGDGRYLILRRTDGTAGTFDLDWDIMVKENGTIQFTNSIWNQSATLYGWDQKIGFDQTEYDQSPGAELEFITTAFLQDIFVGERGKYLTDLWFKVVRYAFTEQKNIDWAFKTTFVNVINNAGLLDQPATYKLQNIQYYENYLEEIKPYHTKIRKFTEQYTSTEYSQSFNTDFDLPTYYNTATLNFNKVQFGNQKLLEYPWKSWYNNYTYQVESINLFDGGDGYVQIPKVTIVPAMGDLGTGATAVAFISLGKITKIIVTNPGKGYAATPSVVISGGGSANFTPARAYAQLGNSPVRKNTVRLRFDRTTANREVGDQYFTETFPPSDGVGTTYDLKWLPVSDKSLIVLTRNGILQLIDSYTISFTEASYSPQPMTSYTKKFATLKLNFVPDTGDVISITYPKSLDLYNAASRVEDYYQPTSGMPGKELAQVMQGVEYSGLQVIGLPFAAQGGWEALGISWAQNAWDNLGLEPGYSTVVVTSTSTQTFSIPELITTGTEVNIYVDKRRIDAPVLNTTTNTTTFVKTVVGLGTGAVDRIEMIVTGSGYNSSYTTWSISAPNKLGGTQAVATATITGGHIAGFTMINNGSGYTEAPTITIIESINPSNPTSTVTIKAYARAVLRAEFNEHGSSITSSTITIPTEAFTSTNSLVTFRYSSSDGTVLPTDEDSLDAIIDGGRVVNGQITNAKGLSPSEIILDGGSQATRNITGMKDDGFLNPINSYAPEECVPGQVQESLGISVFTQPVASSPLITNRRYYVDGTQLTFKMGVTPANADSVIALFNDVRLPKTAYTIDYGANTFTFDTQTPGTGWLSLTTMQLGSIKMLDSMNATTSTTTAELTSQIRFADVGSSYVTVNGQSLTQVSTTGTVGTYTLTSYRGAARVTVFQPGTIQAYLFKGTTKSFSEITDAVSVALNATSIPLSSFSPAITVGNAGPFHSQVIVTQNGRRLKPPVTTYYQVSSGQVLFDISKSIQYTSGLIDLKRIEVYVNGTLLLPARNWKLLQKDNQIRFNKNVLGDGDLVAIVVKQDNEYLIENGNLVLKTASTVSTYITSFTNHDPDFIRSEVFRANPNNQYYMQRAVIDSAYVWVTYNGSPLTVNLDYTVGTDGRTVNLRNGIYQSSSDTVIITSFADREPTIAYRIFRDMLGRTHFKRLAEPGTTRLSQNLSITDEVISVEDASKLSQPDPASNRPGVVLIDGERIEYFVIVNNQLRQLRRSTLGTGSKDVYYAGTTVIDQGRSQTIPFSEAKQSTSTFVTTSTATYSLAGWITLDTITDIYGRPSPAAIDQVEVRYQGITLLKPSLITSVHNSDIAYDSSSTAYTSTATGDTIVPYGFTINTATLQLTLNTATVTLVEGAKLEVIKRTSTSWYNNTSTSLARSTTAPAKFLSGVPASLPRFLSSSTYAVVDLDVVLETNDLLTDENGNPLEGI
jgi:hypothetical protein